MSSRVWPGSALRIDAFKDAGMAKVVSPGSVGQK